MYGLTKDVINVVPVNVLVPQYLAASYCYYHLGESPMQDHVFDHMCARMLREYDQITHPHKRLVSREALQAGTCLLRDEEYPGQVRFGWRDYIVRCQSGVLEKELLARYGKKAPLVVRRSRTPTPAPTAPIIRRRSRVK